MLYKAYQKVVLPLAAAAVKDMGRVAVQGIVATQEQEQEQEQERGLIGKGGLCAR